MKRNNILRISIMPLMLFIVLSFSELQPQKGKNEKGKSEGKEKREDNRGDNDQNKGNKNRGQGNDQDDDRGRQNNKNSHDDDKDRDHDKMMGNKDKHDDDNEREGFGKKDKSDKGKWEIRRGNGNSKIMNGNRDQEIIWGMNNFADRKRPKDHKKVTICHHPSGRNSDYPVNINISENAVQAHLNHGDQVGNCNVNYSDRWSSDYIKSRENVYNTYEQTYETMSYSEALLKYAMERLLGVQTNFNSNRSTYSSQELQRREALILDLQNNVNSLENQLNLTRRRLDSDVNIIVQL